MAWWFSSAFLCAPDNADGPDQAQDGQCTTFKDGSFPDFKGFGKLEIGIAPGDSGGPGFIDGKIEGVHSFGFTHFCEGVTNGTDFTCGLDSSYGEMSGDTSAVLRRLDRRRPERQRGNHAGTAARARRGRRRRESSGPGAFRAGEGFRERHVLADLAGEGGASLTR